MLDVAIEGGLVADGTGVSLRRADVGVRDGRIVAIGRLDEPARTVINAEGKVVCPGFIDIHTHLDAQLLWDPSGAPSPLHGFTTLVGGNCGFTIAPVNPGDLDYIQRLLAKVEDIPLGAMHAGPTWEWSSFGQFLDQLEGAIAPNAGFLVGHSALRRAVMGDEATTGEADERQLDAMEELYRRSLAEGGLGFSSSWSRTHNDHLGKMVPSRWAAQSELVRFCSVTGEFPGTSIEFTPPIPPFSEVQYELMAAMASAAHRPLNFGGLLVDATKGDQIEQTLRAADVARERGALVVMQILPTGFEIFLSFLSGIILDSAPGWAPFFPLPRAQRLAILRDPQQRAALRESAREVAASQLPTAPYFDWSSMRIIATTTPAAASSRGRLIGDIAAEAGEDPFDALVEIVIADELGTVFSPPPRDSAEDWKVRVEVMRDPRAIVGGGDAGAHVTLLAQFNYGTVMLAKAVRELGLMPLEEAVHLLTDRPARLFGLRDRGRVAEGWCADLLVFDPDSIGSGPVHTRQDLPDGSPRLYSEATGIDHVLVNGVPIAEAGAWTGATPGSVIRSGRDTDTVAAGAWGPEAP